jgi:ABC-type antimicrobial peptide transport system permease subunit
MAASVAIALLVGVAGTIVLAAAAGAKRTDTAYQRYLQSTRAAQFLISTQRNGVHSFYRLIQRLPEVEEAGLVAGMPLSRVDARGLVDLQFSAVASEDGHVLYSFGGPRLIAGRMPRRDRPFEALANRTLARQLHLTVGDRLTLHEGAWERYLAPTGRLRGNRPTVTFRIVGIGVSSDEVVPIAENDASPILVLSPAYYLKQPKNIEFDGLFVRLRSGANLSGFVSKVSSLGKQHQQEVGGLFVGNLAEHGSRVERAIRPAALALWVFALLAGVGAALTIGQILVREVNLASFEQVVLRSLGFTRGQMVRTAVLRSLPALVAGALLAVVGAIVASPLLPIGAARVAEPDPGFSLDVPVLAMGFVAIVAVAVGIVALAGWRAASRDGVQVGQSAIEPDERPSRFAEATARMGASPQLVSGIRMALEPGRGRTATPVRSTLIGVLAAVAAITAAVTFGTNINRLVSTPRLFGQTWNFDVDAQFGPIPRTSFEKVRTDPAVAGITGGNYGDDVSIDGRQVPTIGLDVIRGSVFPAIVEGRAPHSESEIVLGKETTRTLGRSIGDEVRVLANGRQRPMRIVGQAVFPAFGRGGFTPTDLGEGAATLASVVRPPYQPAGSYNFFLIRFHPATEIAATTARLERAINAPGGQTGPECQVGYCKFHTTRLPTDIRSYSSVRGTPVVLAGVLALLAVAMLGHALVTTVRRRRRDLAVLKTLGFVKHQIAATVSWEASTFSLIGLVLGIPLGIAAGRWTWTLFADQVGISPSVVVPLALLALVPATLLLANLIAAIPGRAAARTQPAVVLRAE